MADYLCDMDPREVYGENPYDLSDDETMRQDYDEVHPQVGDLCDWCQGPLDADGMCEQRCRSWAKENGVPELLAESLRETLPAARCVCGSSDLETRDYDYGIDPDTGYHDAGTMAVCLNCGRTDEL